MNINRRSFLKFCGLTPLVASFPLLANHAPTLTGRTSNQLFIAVDTTKHDEIVYPAPANENMGKMLIVKNIGTGTLVVDGLLTLGSNESAVFISDGSTWNLT